MLKFLPPTNQPLVFEKSHEATTAKLAHERSKWQI